MSADDGQVLDLTVRILTEIRDEMKRTREDLGARIDGLRAEVHGGLQEVRDEVHRLSGRIDHLLTGPHRDEHEHLKERVTKLEEQVFPPPPTRPTRRARRAR